MHATMPLAASTAPAIPGAGTPPTPEAWEAAFAVALPYLAYLDRFTTPDQRSRWDAFHKQVALTAAQKTLLGSFKRKMPVLVLSGGWCGDCMTQCPIFDHFAAASPAIDLRFLDRDARPDIAAHIKVCGGQRVPTVAFLSEDWHLVVFYGDKTLSAYRAAAAAQMGASCATGLATPPADAVAAATADWLDEFERVQLILRLSGRLREKYGE